MGRRRATLRGWAALALRAGHNRLAWRRCTSWRRTNRVPFAAKAGHFGERGSAQRSTHWNRRTHWSHHRNRRTQWRSHRNRSSHRNRCSDRHRSTDRHRRRHRNRPGQGQRNTGHVGQWRASRTARGRRRRSSRRRGRRRRSRCRRAGSSCPAGRRLHAFVAAGQERNGRRSRAEGHGEPAQPSRSNNYLDVDSIKDHHRRRPFTRTLTFRIHVVQQNCMPHRGCGRQPR